MNRLIRTTALCTLLLLLGTALAPATAQTSFNRVWEQSDAQNGSPSYFGNDNATRAIAYGSVDDGSGTMVDRVFVATGGGANSDAYGIKVHRASDGALDPDQNELNGVGSLPTPSDGRTLGDVGVSDDGVIIACNSVNNAFTSDGATENFRCWRWNSLTDSPTEIINFTPPDQDGDGEGDWLARLFTVVGSASDNSLTILAAASKSSVNVYRFTTSDNGQSFSSTTITRSGRPPSGNINAASPVAPGASDFLFNELTTEPIRYNNDGSEQARDQGAFSSFSHSIKFFEVGSKDWALAFNWESCTNGNFAELVDVTAGFDQGLPEAQTPTLADCQGNDNINGTGDVDYRINDDNTATVYVLGTNYGLGAYTTADPLPVEFAAFDATTTGDAVELTWATASETNNAGFYVERAAGNGDFRDVGFRSGAGTTTESTTYRFRDTGVPFEAETVRYRLRQVDTDGSTNYSETITVERRVDAVRLLGSAPNPVSGSATVRYAIPQATDVRLAVYDVLGREVTVLVNDRQRGRKQARLDVSDWAAGTYFLRLQAGDRTETGRLTVVK